MGIVARFRRLTWRERGVLCAALVLLPAVAAGLRLVGLRRVQSVLGLAGPAVNREARGPVCGTGVQGTARMVAAAAHYGLYRASCLPRSLVLQWLLHRQGIVSALRIGARTAGGRLEAHAWVEHHGHPLIDAADVQDRFPAFEGHTYDVALLASRPKSARRAG